MSHDETEVIRKQQVATINVEPGSREALEAEYGQVWTTGEMCKDFAALGFLAPYVVVVRNSDGVKGTLMFQHDPRFYFSFASE